MYFFMLANPTFDDFDLSSLRLCAVGGQTKPEPKMREVEQRFGCPLIELSGDIGQPKADRAVLVWAVRGERCAQSAQLGHRTARATAGRPASRGRDFNRP